MSESNEDLKKKEKVYRVKGIPIDAYLDERGEFGCVPKPSACNETDGARTLLEVFGNMPAPRRDVWVPRLDREETLARCSLLRTDAELSKKFDELCAAYDSNRRKPKQTAQQEEGGEKAK